MAIHFVGDRSYKWKIIALILAILLVCSVVYVVIGRYRQLKESEKLDLINSGYVYAIVQIMHQASTCKPVALYSNNITMNLVEISCLKNYTLK